MVRTRPYSFAMAGLLLALVWLLFAVGCGGGGQATLPPVDEARAAARMAQLSDQVFGSRVPVPDDAAPLVRGLLNGSLGDGIPMPGGLPFVLLPEGNVDTTVYGLHIVAAWDTQLIPLRIVGNATVSGTVTGAPEDYAEANGTAVAATVSANVVNGTGHVTLTGDFTPPGESTYHVNANGTVSGTQDLLTLHMVGRVTQGTEVVLTSDLNMTVDRSDTEPQVSTTGSVTITDPQTPSTEVTLTTVTPLVTTVDPQTFAITYVSGTVRIADNHGLVATVTVQPDGTLSGPVTNSAGQTIGTLTVVNGHVTVTLA